MLIGNISESNNLLLFLTPKYKLYKRFIKLTSDLYHSSTFWMSKFWEHIFFLFKIHDPLLKLQEIVGGQKTIAFLQQFRLRVTVGIEDSQLLQLLYLQPRLSLLLAELPRQELQALRRRQELVDVVGHGFVVRHVI